MGSPDTTKIHNEAQKDQMVGRSEMNKQSMAALDLDRTNKGGLSGKKCDDCHNRKGFQCLDQGARKVKEGGKIVDGGKG